MLLEQERRRRTRVACHLQLSDGQINYALLDFNTEGMRVRGEPFDQPKRFALVLGQERIEFLGNVVRQAGLGRDAELGLTVTGNDEAMSRLGFLAAALVHIPPEDVRWLPFHFRPGQDEVAREKERLAKIILPSGNVRAMEASVEVHRRTDFTWQWYHDGIDALTLRCVAESDRRAAIELKLTYSILQTMLDDAADLLRDPDIVEALKRDVLSFSDRASAPEGLRETARVWSSFVAQCRALPSAALVFPWFRFDHETICHAMTYSLLANRQPEAQNRSELHGWNTHSIYLFAFADIDLMFARDVAPSELGSVREIIGHAQEMCAIGNWLTTWEHEFYARDISSGIASSAYEQLIFTIEDLDEPTHAIAAIRRAHVEEYWMAQWEKHWHAIRALPSPPLFDRDAYLQAVRHIYHLQMIDKASRAPR